jgi:hypothetical protein
MMVRILIGIVQLTVATKMHAIRVAWILLRAFAVLLISASMVHVDRRERVYATRAILASRVTKAMGCAPTSSVAA